MKKLCLIILCLLSLNSFSQTTSWSSSPPVTPQTRLFGGSPQLRFIWTPSYIFSLSDTLTGIKSSILLRELLSNKATTYGTVNNTLYPSIQLMRDSTLHPNKNLSDVTNKPTALVNLGAAAVGQTMYIGTTAHALNRTSASEALTGITSIDGSAAKWTTGRTVSITGDIAYTSPSIDGSGNVTAAATLPTVNSNVGSFNTLTVNGKGQVTAASNTSYESPLTFSTGLTRATNTVTVNTSQNITNLTNLNTAGFVKTTGVGGALSIDNSIYLTGNQTISFAPTGDVTGSTTGTTTLAPALTIGAGKVTNTMIAAGTIDLTTKVTGLLPNSNLANSTISGVSLGGTLAAHSTGYGLLGSNYTGGATQTWTADTASAGGLMSKARAAATYKQKADTSNAQGYSSLSRLITTTDSIRVNPKIFLSTNNSITWFGDSYTDGHGATDTTRNFRHIVSARFFKTAINLALSGTGTVYAAYQGNQLLSLNQKTSVMLLAGFNDTYRGGSNAKTLSKIRYSDQSTIASALLKTAVPGNDASITTAGTWTGNSYFAYGGRATYLGGLGRSSIVSGSTLTVTVNGDNVVIGTLISDGVTQLMGPFTVTIDGHLRDTFNGNGLSDGISDGVYNNQLNPTALPYTGLGLGNHTVVITTTSTSPVYIDYIGTLQSPETAPPVLLGLVPNISAAGYAIPPALANDGVHYLANQQIIAAINQFKGFPVGYYYTNKYLTLAGLGGLTGIDYEHPNDLGERQISDAISERIITGQQRPLITTNDAGNEFSIAGNLTLTGHAGGNAGDYLITDGTGIGGGKWATGEYAQLGKFSIFNIKRNKEVFFIDSLNNVGIKNFKTGLSTDSLVVHKSSDGTLQLISPTSLNIGGNAATATALQNSRTIGIITGDATGAGSSFNGTANNTNSITVTKVNGVSFAGLATGILKNTTTTGVPSIAIAADFPTLNQNTTGTANNITAYTINQNLGTTNSPTFATVTANSIIAGTASGGAVMSTPSAGTNAAYSYWLNTGGGYYIGGERSTGGGIITGSTGYDLAITGPSGIALSANNGSSVQFRIASNGNANFTNNVTALNNYSTSSTPSISAGVAAGTSPTVSITGNNQDGIITIITGTSPVIGTLCTVTMSGSFAYPNTCATVFTPYSSTSLSIASRVDISNLTTTSFSLGVPATPLGSSTQYQFTYHNGGY